LPILYHIQPFIVSNFLRCTNRARNHALLPQGYVNCYRFVSDLPKNETYGLISQTQRAAISIPANNAEGHGRDHMGDYLRHISIANGSLMELETHLLLIGRLGYRSADDAEPLLAQCSEVGKMLAGLSKSLRGKQ